MYEATEAAGTPDDKKAKRRLAAKKAYRKYRSKNIERAIAYRKANKERLNNARRIRVDQNREKFKKQSREIHNRNRIKPEKRMILLMAGAKQRSKKKGIAFDAGFIRLWIKTPASSCECCGERFVYSNGHSRLAPTIDRIDNTLGYVAGNVALLCRGCNTLKSDATSDVLRRMANWIDSKLSKSKAMAYG